MLEFSLQERRFLLFLLTAFLIGCAVTWYRNSRGDATLEKWLARHKEMSRELSSQQALRTTLPEKTAAAAPPQGLAERKQRLIARLNINTASAEELAALERIGPVMAARIIAHRQEHGPFRTIEGLQEVKGIGPGTLAKIRDRITVE
jgi:competence protein ComEA